MVDELTGQMQSVTSGLASAYARIHSLKRTTKEDKALADSNIGGLNRDSRHLEKQVATKGAAVAEPEANEPPAESELYASLRQERERW